MTSVGASRSQGVTVDLDNNSTDNGKVTDVVLCYQLRSLDLTARRTSNADTLEPHVMDEILSLVIALIDPR